MIKSEFIDRIHEFGETQSRDHAQRLFEVVLEVISEALERKEEIRILGFGRFFTLDIEARTMRNPRTGGTLDIPTKTFARFKAGAVLSRRINH